MNRYNSNNNRYYDNYNRYNNNANNYYDENYQADNILLNLLSGAACGWGLGKALEIMFGMDDN